MNRPPVDDDVADADPVAAWAASIAGLEPTAAEVAAGHRIASHLTDRRAATCGAVSTTREDAS